MSEIKRILKLLKVSFDSDDWLFPGMNDSLEGVTTEEAVRRPLSKAHNIAEIVNHVTQWENTALMWLRGENPKLIYQPPKVWDWSEINEFTGEEWTAVVKELRDTHARLVAAVSKIDDRDLTSKIPKGEFTIYELLHGIIQHNLYHAGQIALLKKAEG